MSIVSNCKITVKKDFEIWFNKMKTKMKRNLR